MREIEHVLIPKVDSSSFTLIEKKVEDYVIRNLIVLTQKLNFELRILFLARLLLVMLLPVHLWRACLLLNSE